MSFLIHRLEGDRTLLRTVEGDRLTIGRGASADVRLDDAAVGLEHAEIRREGTDWVLGDRGSVTGTYRNGRQVDREILGGDDTVEIGGYRLRLQVTHPDDPLFVHLSAAEAEAPAASGLAQEESRDGARDTAAFEISAVESAASREPSESGESGGEALPTAPRSARVQQPGARPRPATVDYAAAYSLARPGWTKGALTVLLTIGALITVAALAAGSHRPLMPGISSAHALIVAGGPAFAVAGSAEHDAPAGAFLDADARHIATRGCAACHRPWRGPVAVEEGCVGCHGEQSEPHARSLASVATACASCHPEHRDQALVRPTAAGDCTSCHRELSTVVPNVAVAPRVTSFAGDHPELTITLPAVEGEERIRRISVADADGADPGTVDFGHRKHRVQEDAGGAAPGQAVRGPDGPVSLACGDCHVADADTGLMRPVRFEDHCQSCHRLSFDDRYPDRQAPHATPREVEDFLVGLYSRSDSGPGSGVSLRQRRLGVITGGGRRSLPPGVDRQVADAARTLFRSGCDFCHRVDLDAVPLPAVAPPAIPEGWMRGARFSHLDHRNVACGTCHPNAAASAASADVLMPGIAVCRSCHGAGAEGGSRDGAVVAGGTTAGSAEGGAWGGLLACAQCHAYHRSEISRPAPPLTAAVAGPSFWRIPG